MAPEPQPGPRGENPWRQVGVALGLVFTIPAAVAIGALLGMWLDGKAGTAPLFVLLFVGAGFVGGVLEVLREVKRISRP